MLAALAVLLASLLAGPAVAQDPGEPCVASVPVEKSLDTGRQWAARYTCDGELPAMGPGRIAVLLGTAQPSAKFMESRNGYFDELVVLAVKGDRIVDAKRYDPDKIPAALTDVGFSVPLPTTGVSARSAGEVEYVAVFEGAEFPATITRARLASEPINQRPDTLVHLTVIAIMMGFLLLPVIFDFAFLRALNASFLIWHAALALAMAWHLSTSGLLGVFAPISVTAMNNQAILSYAALMMCAIMFATRFVEEDKQSPALRRAMFAWMGVLIVLTGLRMARIDAFMPFSAKAYHALFVPLLGMVVLFIAIAVRRGSRAIWFQIAAWLPFFLQGVIRVATMLGDGVHYIEAVWLFRIGAASEVAITALGIIDRVMLIKRERDAALTEARMLEQLSSRDALTGLMNRGALEARFDDLLRQGFDTFALVDLDRFKLINDRHGHQVGDGALVACAAALRGNDDRDSVAARLGGEEFVVLLRGQRTLERAENLRRAIPLRIASQVPGLGEPVTASMGVIELPRASAHSLNFEDFYARADTLMYEAKASGRNRMSYEKLTMFDTAPPSRAQVKEREKGKREAA